MMINKCQKEMQGYCSTLQDTLHGCTIESILTGCITVWYDNCTTLKCETLHPTREKTAQHITRMKLPPMQDLYTQRCRKKANRIIKECHGSSRDSLFFLVFFPVLSPGVCLLPCVSVCVFLTWVLLSASGAPGQSPYLSPSHHFINRCI